MRIVTAHNAWMGYEFFNNNKNQVKNIIELWGASFE